MKGTIKFAILGCGRIGSRHAVHIVENNRAELSFVCDIIHERADSFAKEYNSRAVYSCEELFRENVDVISICTPSGDHAEQSISALEGGFHVLCEKPMALNLSDSDRIIKAEKISGRNFFLVKQNRYNKPIKLLKDAVYNNRLGRITLINSDVFWNRSRSYYEKDAWKGTMAKDGGALMTQCSHFFDLMIWIGGPIFSVTGMMTNLAHPYIETEDTGLIIVRFINGAIGSLQYTTCAYRQNFEGSITILGTEGIVRIGGQYLNKLDYWDVKDIPEPVIADEIPLIPNEVGSYNKSISKHGDVIENVIAVLLDGEKINTNSVQGRESTEGMQAAYISAIERREVMLPLSGNDANFRINKQPPLSGIRKNV